MTIQDLERYSPHNSYHDMRDQLQRVIYARADAALTAGDATRDALQSVSQVEARKEQLRTAFIEGLGGLPPMDTPLNARVVEIVPEDGFRIEKVIFESRPDTFVTANLYVPEGITAPRGAVLLVCGHHEQSKHAGEYQVVIRHLVRAGLVVLAQDPVGQGERLSYWEPALGRTTVRWGTGEHDYAGAQCWPLGDGLARYFVHDAMRSIDYLRTRPEVDPERIGVTGNSGGGTQTCLMMVCDPRIAAAAPGTFLMDRRSYMHAGGAQDAEQIWPGVTALGFDHADILLMMAPKPVLVLAVTSDFFPIEGTRRSVARAGRLWELYGAAGGLRLFEDDSIHAYTRPMVRAAAEFFSEHLLGRKVSPDGAGIEAIEPARLLCTHSGQVRGEIAGARGVHEENRDRLAAVATERAALPPAQRKERALAWLRERVSAHRRPCDFNLRRYHTEPCDDLVAEFGFWFAQEGICNDAFVLRDYRFEGQDLPVTLAVWDGGTTCLQAHLTWIRETCAAGRAVMVLNTSGVGGLSPNPLNAQSPHAFYGVLFKLAHELMWLGDSLAALRVGDVLRALDVLPAWRGLRTDDLRCYAHGRQGVYARLAAALDARIRGVDVVEGMGSYAEWVGARHYDQYDIMGVVIPAMLRYFDLPDLEA